MVIELGIKMPNLSKRFGYLNTTKRSHFLNLPHGKFYVFYGFYTKIQWNRLEKEAFSRNYGFFIRT